jgi:hypothetical protein
VPQKTQNICASGGTGGSNLKAAKVCSVNSAYQPAGRPFVAAGITAFVYGVFLLARLAAHGFDPSYFVVAGTDYYDAASSHRTLRTIREGPGYDGQFYYRLAIEPFSRSRADHGVSFDAPAYREQRILYPLLAFIFSAGNAAWVPWALIFVNYVGLCAVAGLGAMLASLAGRTSMWGVAFALYPGFIFTLSRDLTEIVAAAFLLAGILFMRKARHGYAAACLSLAVFARETTIVVPVALLAFLLWSAFAGQRNLPGQERASYYAVPVILYAAWQTYLGSVWSAAPALQGFDDAIGLPFSGISGLWSRAWEMPSRLLLIWCVETCLIALHVAMGLYIYSQLPDFAVERMSLFLYAGMSVCLTAGFWPEDQAFFRVTAESFLLGFLALLQDRRQVLIPISLIWLLVSCFTFGWRVEW